MLDEQAGIQKEPELLYEWESSLKLESPYFIARPIISVEQPFDTWNKTGRQFILKDGVLVPFKEIEQCLQ